MNYLYHVCEHLAPVERDAIHPFALKPSNDVSATVKKKTVIVTCPSYSICLVALLGGRIT